MAELRPPPPKLPAPGYSPASLRANPKSNFLSVSCPLRQRFPCECRRGRGILCCSLAAGGGE
jgi:hypothetical protein